MKSNTEGYILTPDKCLQRCPILAKKESYNHCNLKTGQLNRLAVQLCLLDTVGTIFKRAIVDRLENHFDEKSIITSSKHNFLIGHSLYYSCHTQIEVLIAMRTRQFCITFNLNIHDAFNMKPWSQVLVASLNVKIPGYLIRIVRPYLNNRDQSEDYMCGPTHLGP